MQISRQAKLTGVSQRRISRSLTVRRAGRKGMTSGLVQERSRKDPRSFFKIETTLLLDYWRGLDRMEEEAKS